MWLKKHLTNQERYGESVYLKREKLIKALPKTNKIPR